MSRRRKYARERGFTIFKGALGVLIVLMALVGVLTMSLAEFSVNTVLKGLSRSNKPSAAFSFENPFDR